jgi:UDP-glucuronate 4-epimerase
MQRDFTFIDDIVDGIIASLKLSLPHEIFNLGNNNPENLKDFIGHIETATGKKAKLKYLPMQQGDMLKTYADIEHAKKTLGFEPKTPLKQGIEKFVNWYRSYYGIS